MLGLLILTDMVHMPAPGKACCRCSFQRRERKDMKITCGAGTLLASNFSRSLALMMTYGSYVFRDVFTVIEPSICQAISRNELHFSKQGPGEAQKKDKTNRSV